MQTALAVHNLRHAQGTLTREVARGTQPAPYSVVALRYHPARRAVNQTGAQTLPIRDYPHPLAAAPALQAHHAREEAITKDLAALAEGHVERTQSSRLLVALMRDAPIVPGAAPRFIERLSPLLPIQLLSRPH